MFGSHNSKDTIARRLAEWIVRSSLGTIPSEVVTQAKHCLVDIIGVGIAGTQTDLSRRVRGYIRRQYGNGACSVFGSRSRMSPTGAAFANGVSSHALDFDDTSYAGITHPSAVVFPAVAAIAESEGHSGQDLLTAFIIGVEVECTIGKLATDYLYTKGWFNTAVLGTIGAAVAVAKICQLNEAETANVLGVAACQTMGLRIGLGSDLKPYLAGRAAETGLQSALLSRNGLISPLDAFEGRWGFLALFNDGVKDDTALEQLGLRYSFIDPGIAFKIFPIGSAAHAAAEAVRNIMTEKSISLTDIDFVTCEVTPLVYSSLRFSEPKTITEARFSMSFAVGCMLVFGKLDLQVMKESVICDRTLQQAMLKVKMIVSAELEANRCLLANCPEGAFVVIQTTNGEQTRRFCCAATGSPPNPIPEADLEEKYHACAAFAGQSRGAAEITLERIKTIELMPSVSLLLEHCTELS